MVQKVASKQPQKKAPVEDLSRWENEGGSAAPGISRDTLSEVEKHPLGERFERAFGLVKDRVESIVRERPLVAIGIASAIGFVLAGGLGTKAGRRLAQRVIEIGLL